VRAVEDALGIQVPNNARILRNLIEAIQYVQDHVIHFYHLHALDWVDIVSGLQADPEATFKLASSISDWPLNSPAHFKAVKERLAAFVATGQLGPFANAYWGHSAYKLPPEANLMATTHYLDALDFQREFIKGHAILGAKNPHLQTYLVGGMASPIDPDSQAALNADKLAAIRGMIAKAKQFVMQVYLPDVLAVAPFYLDWAGVGEGTGNFLSYGDWPDAAGKFWMPDGVILNRDLSQVLPVDHQKIKEYVSHSWYSYDGGNGDGVGKHPWEGQTEPNYTGPKPPYKFLNTGPTDKYTWMKAPRFEDQPMEVGPLARMLIAYASGHKEVQDTVNLVLQKVSESAGATLGPEVLFSTLGRIAARCAESVVVVNKLDGILDELIDSIGSGDIKVHEGKMWNPANWPAEAEGFGRHEAPRGSLGHWIRIKNKKIENYQCVVPSTWNCSPRDPAGKPGPYEAALIGTPIADPEKPLEVLRTIHSFDPCMACGVHVVDAQGREITQVTFNTAKKC
jgi:Ni,Fe-hydrogenase I large subunit